MATTTHYTDDGSVAVSARTSAPVREMPAFGAESNVSGLSWSAILGGGCASLALTSSFVFLGTTLGLSDISVWQADETWLSMGTKAIIFIIATQWVSSALGGYMAGRLRTKWANIHADEVFFRDTAHGFLSWGISTLAMLMLVSMTSFATLSATNDTAQTVQSSPIVQQVASDAVSPSANPMDYDVDSLIRTTDSTLPVVGAEKRSELSRVLMKQQAGMEMSVTDRSFLEQSAMTHAGLSQAEAVTRVNTVLGDINARAETAKQKVEETRKALQKTSLLLFLSLIVGAFVASVAAAIGGRNRDEI